MRSRILFRTIFATALVVGAFGCSGSGGLKTHKVSGKVTLDGQPLPNASVTFIPIAPDGKKLEGEGKQATGQTESDGSFSLGTFSTSDGAIAGDYKVTVNYSESGGVVQEIVVGLGDKQKNMKTMLDALAKQKGKKKEPPRFVVPKKYSEFHSTPLKQTVPPPGRVEFELKSK